MPNCGHWDHNFPEERLLTLADLRKIIPASKSAIYEWIRDGLFPRPIRIGLRRRVWRWTEVAEWMATRTDE
ncbi:MAG: AlpA family phage regulatory protein [Hyphomicrobium sp.]|nr:AlpA family phage regulatory protein [Hyphomicrobium sp.]